MTNINTATRAELRETLRNMRAENLDVSTQLDLIHADVIDAEPITCRHNGGRIDPHHVTTIRAGRLMVRCLAKNAARTAAKLRSACRTPSTRQHVGARVFPKFEAGMSTAAYVTLYACSNNGTAGAQTLPYNLTDYATPCTLYENGALDFDAIEEPIDAPEATESPEMVAIVSELTGATMASIPREKAEELAAMIGTTVQAARQVSELIASATTAAALQAAPLSQDQAAALQQHGKDWDGRELCGYYLSEKLDGCRAYWDGSNLYTKTGRRIDAPTITATLPAGFALDGEIYAGRGRFEDARLFVQYGKTPERVQFIAFDAPGLKNKDWPLRLDEIRAHGVPCVDCVQAYTMADVLHALRTVLEAGGEGLMARIPSNEYKPGRSSNLMKLKRHSLAYFSDEPELATVDACSEASATTCDASSASSAPSAPQHGRASSAAHQAPAAPTFQTITGKSGNWCARFRLLSDGAPVLEFSTRPNDWSIYVYATGRERMAALQAMARKADQDAQPDDQDDPQTARQRRINAFDAMTATAADVQAMGAEYVAQLLDDLEDINYHTEGLILQALAAGREDLAARARANLREHLAAGFLTDALREDRQAIGEALRQSTNPDPTHPAADTPSSAPAGAPGYPTPAPNQHQQTAPVPNLADEVPRAVGVDSEPESNPTSATAPSAPAPATEASADESEPEFTRTAPQPFDMLAMIAAGLAPDDFVGLGIVYNGDRANPSGRGAITDVQPCSWYKYTVTVTLEDGRQSRLNPVSFTEHLGNRYKTDFKRHGAPYLAELTAARLAIEAADKAAKQAAADDKARQRRELPQQWPQLKAYEQGGKLWGCTLAAHNIRVLLKEKFPKVKFSVKSDKFSGGDSISIRWTDGPSAKSVEEISNMFEAGSFNGMEDIYEYSHSTFRDLFGDAKYIHVNRDHSDAAIAQAIEALYLNTEGRPTVEDYRKARGMFDYHENRGAIRRLEQRLDDMGDGFQK